jgi:hypothetical protein
MKKIFLSLLLINTAFLMNNEQKLKNLIRSIFVQNKGIEPTPPVIEKLYQDLDNIEFEGEKIDIKSGMLNFLEQPNAPVVQLGVYRNLIKSLCFNSDKDSN